MDPLSITLNRIKAAIINIFTICQFKRVKIERKRSLGSTAIFIFKTPVLKAHLEILLF